MALFYAVIKIEAVSLLMFPFLSHVNVFSCEISLFRRLKYTKSSFFFSFLFCLVFFFFTQIKYALSWMLDLVHPHRPPCPLIHLSEFLLFAF